MVNDDRFGKVKGLIISLLENSYSKRVRIAVIGYGGGHAQLILPFTSSTELAADRITVLRGGGSTPLIPALGIAGDIIDRMQDENLSVCIVSDGNYDRHVTGNETFQIEHFGHFCKSRNIHVTLVYAGRTNKTALKRSMLFASKLGAEYYQLEDLRSPEESQAASK